MGQSPENWDGRRPKHGLRWKPPTEFSARQARNTRAENHGTHGDRKICGYRSCQLCTVCQPHSHDRGRPAATTSRGNAYMWCDTCKVQYRRGQTHRHVR